MVSVIVAPFRSIPEITYEFEVVSVLDVKSTFAPKYVEVDNGPSNVREPAELTYVSFFKLSKSFISLLPMVPILILPLAVAEEVIEVIVLNFVDPNAVFEEPTPVISSVIEAPSSSVPATVKVFPVSEAEQ